MKMKTTIGIALTLSTVVMLTGCGTSEGGEDGSDGADGSQGSDGEDGAEGPQGPEGPAGMDGAGEPGADGADGSDGEDGIDGANGTDGTSGTDGTNGADGADLKNPPRLTRLATTPLASELTGMEKTANGDFFFNVQHPSTSLPGDEGKAAVGAWVGVDVDSLDPYIESLPVPDPTTAAAQTTQVVTGSYQVLGREGDTFTAALPAGFGNIVAADGVTPIKQSNNPDFNAFIPSDANSEEGYLFSAWEDRPGGMTRLAINKGEAGWDVTDAMNVDFSSVNGTMINCFGSTTPWGTPMTAEENYEAENTERWNDATYTSGYPSYPDVQKIQDYLGGTFPNPYDYGYIVEIMSPTAGAPVPVKHFTMGRSAHENPIVMPDRRTVYLTDDGGNKGFYKFVADAPDDLSEGSLYAAKVVQDATTNSAKAGFYISWIFLAHASNDEIENWISDYDTIDESDYVAGETSYISDDEVAEWAAGDAADDRVAFLETLRAAEAKGATVEFNKMEGININYAGAASGAVPFMYVGMAEVRGAMADGTGDINVTENRCGIVYRFGLTSDFDVVRMDPVVVGGAYDGTSTTDRCDTGAIAQPDNVLVLNDGRVLIGEDSSNHKNNMLWIFNPAGM